MAIERIKLNLIPAGTMPVCHASQYDKKRQIGIDIYIGLQPYILSDELLELDVRKPDGHIVTIDVPYTAGGNGVVFDTTEQMCAVAGLNLCELKITKGEAEIGSLNFYMEIERSPMENGLASDSEIANLRTQMQAIAEPMLDDLVPPMVETLVPEVVGDNYYNKNEINTIVGGIDSALEGIGHYIDGINDDIDNLETALGSKADTTYVDTELAKKADKTDTYTKTQVDTALNGKADVTDLPDMTQYYDKSEVDDLLDDKANSDDVYGKAYIDTALSGKANVGTSYTKSEEDALLDDKADKSDTYTKEQVDDIVYNILPDDTASGSVANFTTSLELPLKSLEIDVNAKQDLHGYDYPWMAGGGKNLCPPMTGVNANGLTITVDSDGKITVSGTATGTGGYLTSFIDLAKTIPSGTAFSISVTNAPPSNLRAFFDQGTADIAGGATKSNNITWNIDITKARLYLFTTAGQSYNFSFYFQIEIGSTATSYAPYENICPIEGWSSITLDVNANTEVINLGGTYYGGHFTQDKDGHRQFEVTHGIILFRDINFSRSNNGGAWSSYLFYSRITDKTNGGVVKCSNYEYVSNQTTSNVQNEKIIAPATSNYVYIRDDAYTTVADFKTANANTQLVYELATPVIIDLPDGEPIITLNGTNNIYADTGDTEVVFKSSVNDYVSAHSGGNLLGMGGVYLGGAKSGGSEEEPDEGEDTEKVKLDEPKEEVKTIGDVKKLGGE